MDRLEDVEGYAGKGGCVKGYHPVGGIRSLAPTVTASGWLFDHFQALYTPPFFEKR